MSEKERDVEGRRFTICGTIHNSQLIVDARIMHVIISTGHIEEKK